MYAPISNGWSSRKLKHVARIQSSNVDKKSDPDEIRVRLCNYTDVYYHERLTNSLPLMEATATPEEVRRFGLRPGDVLLTKDSETWDDIGVPAYVAEPIDRGVCGYHLAHLRPWAGVVDGAFLALALSARGVREQFHIAANGITRYGLTLDDLGEVRVPTPPLPAQRAIAAFLDRETGKIDALLQKKRRLLALLDEKRRSYLEHIVGGSPEHRKIKLRHVVDILGGYAFPSTGFSRPTGSTRLLRGVNVAPGAIDWTDSVHWPAEEAGRFTRYQLSPGDIVLGMDRPWISSGIRVARISQADVPALLLQRVARLRSNPSFLLQDYLELVLASPQFRAYFEPILTGVSVPHISPTQIGNFHFPIPSIEDQHAQVEEFSLSQRHTEGLAAALRRSRNLLVEYRRGIISAAVTGRIDVESAA